MFKFKCPFSKKVKEVSIEPEVKEEAKVAEVKPEVKEEPVYKHINSTSIFLKAGGNPGYCSEYNTEKEAKVAYKKELKLLNDAVSNNTIYVNENVTLRGEDISYFIVTQKKELQKPVKSSIFG